MFIENYRFYKVVVFWWAYWFQKVNIENLLDCLFADDMKLLKKGRQPSLFFNKNTINWRKLEYLLLHSWGNEIFVKYQLSKLTTYLTFAWLLTVNIFTFSFYTIWLHRKSTSKRQFQIYLEYRYFSENQNLKSIGGSQEN